MTNEVNGFSQLLEEMRAHAKLRVAEPQTQPFTPSTPALQSLLATLQNTRNRSNFNTDDVINQLKDAAKQGATGVANGVQGRISNATQTYQQDGNHSEFTNNMNDIRNYAKQAINGQNGQMDQLYDQAVDLENQYPDAAQAIIQFMDVAENVFDSLVSRIQDFIMNAIQDSAWLSDAGQNIKDFFAKLDNWISSVF
jgi:ABC-type transporter Mla subunit MlaD